MRIATYNAQIAANDPDFDFHAAASTLYPQAIYLVGGETYQVLSLDWTGRRAVVETGCRYFSSIAFPDRIDAGVRVTRLGNSSVRYEIALFRAGEQVAVAEGHFIHVYVDRHTRRPVTLPQPLREVLARISVPA